MMNALMMLYKISYLLPAYSVVESTLATKEAPEISRDYSNNGGILGHFCGIFRLRSNPGTLGRTKLCHEKKKFIYNVIVAFYS